MEILDHSFFMIVMIFFASNVIISAIFGDPFEFLKIYPAVTAALEHSKSYYRSPISLLAPLVMWSAFILGQVMGNLSDQRFGRADVFSDLVKIALWVLFGGLGVYLARKIRTRTIQIFMRRHEQPDQC